MVSLPHALELARHHGLVDDATALALSERMKGLHFTLRTPGRLQSAVSELVPSPEALLEFLAAPEQDLERRDAIALLRLISEKPGQPAQRARFESTAWWKHMTEHHDAACHALMGRSTTAFWGYFRLREADSGGLLSQAWLETMEDLVARQLSLVRGDDWQGMYRL